MQPEAEGSDVQMSDEETGESCAPTFNVQEELVAYHVCTFGGSGRGCFALTPMKYSPADQYPWRALLTVMTTRDSDDVKNFRSSTGL